MLRRTLQVVAGAALAVLAGCATTRSPGVVAHGGDPVLPAPAVLQAGYLTDERRDEGEETLPFPKAFAEERPASRAARMRDVGLPELIGLTLERNPRLAQVGWAVESARGRAVQAGLYPNPTFSFTADELGDREGPVGILTAMATQEIVTANKLGLSQAAAHKEVDQATLNTITERYRVFTEVRQAFYELSTLQSRANILEELVTLAERSTENAEKLLKAKEAARLDVVQLEVDLERYKTELEATRRAMPGAYRRLAASVGVPEMPEYVFVCDFDTPPADLDLDRVRAYVLGVHPEVRSAQVGVERAKLLAQRAEVEPVPNVTVGAGYVYQGQNRSNDAVLSVSVPVPCWNKNQGNILAAKAEVAEALNRVGRTQNELAARLATSFSTYAAARRRAERYRTAILPKAEETYRLSLRAYQGGQFEYLRVLAAQRAVAEARLERVRALGEMWQAASEIAGLMLEDHWPARPAPAPPR